MQCHIMVEKYQYKPPAMLFFSFKEILFLDADEFPLNNLEILFTSESFTIYYKISPQKPAVPKSMLISRKMNPSPNPSSLHILQFPVTQGVVGEGDKEIFLAAANMLNEPFYQVRSPTLGCHKNGLWVHSLVPPWSNTIPSTTTLPQPIKRSWGMLVSHFLFMQTSPSSPWP